MKKRFILTMTLLLLLASIRNVPCAPEHRVALVIGNSEYRNTQPLNNSTNDARDLGQALENCGFSVTILTDVTRKQMLEAIRQFGKEINCRDCVALFSFSGHGVQVNHMNYLVPVDARIEHENEVEDYCVKTSAILRKMETASNKLNILILDACRKNPFVGTTRATQQGLAQETAPPGSLIAFATAPNNTASDGPGLKNGLYTSFLLKHLREPGLSLLSLFNKVGHEVMEASAGKQVPWFHSSPLPPFTFVAGGSTSIVSPSMDSDRGNLRIETEPPEAEVWLNGRRKGKSPLVIEDLAGGRIQLQAKLKDHHDAKETVLVERGKEVTVRLFLDPLISTGTLRVMSEPSGAKFYFDGALVGETPKGMKEVKEGRHEVLLKKKGYKYYKDIVYLGADESITVKADLKPETHMTNSIGQVFVLIPSGTFMMGSGLSAQEVADQYGGEADWYQDEHPQHQVKITTPFYLQTREVTVGQWREFVTATGYMTEAETGGGAWIWTDHVMEKKEDSYWDNPGFQQTDAQPVTCVSWNDAQKFIEWLNKKEGVAGYRLPTEAEWEYACRGGTMTVNYWGNEGGKACGFANAADTTAQKKYPHWPIHVCEDGQVFTAPVGSYEKNDFGLYDMIGNVLEWCRDVYSRSVYTPEQRIDPVNLGDGLHRVVRGGSWSSYPRFCRSANRGRHEPSSSYAVIGFRLARTF